MAVQERLYTPEDLWELIHKAEGDRRLELLEGEIVEMSPVGDTHSEVAGTLFRLVANHVVAADLGKATIEAGFIIAPDTVCGPDVGFIAKERLPPRTGRFYNIAPDLAVEVISPSETPRQVHRKVNLYLKAGVRLVWVVYPDDRLIVIYRPDAPTTTLLNDEDILDGGEVLPGFAVTVGEVFAGLW